MKLRLRSLDSKETLKIEVPDSCSLQQLKETISRAIASSSSSSSSSLHLSLNRKDEIHASSPHDPIHSIGIAPGDLVFYTLNPNALSRETLPHKPSPQEETNPRDGTTIQDSPGMDASDVPSAEKSPTVDASEAESMKMVDGSDEAVAGKGNSVPLFVKRTIRESNSDDVSDFKILVLAVHAIILESGFVRVDQVSGMAVSCPHRLDDLPWAVSSLISLRYTLPEILTDGSSHTVNLKIQTLGDIVNVCGSLTDDASASLHTIYLDKCKFARPLKLMLPNSDVFELWKMVKDELALPLLIDLCEKAGLNPPPCFMRLPTELKMKILEYLPGVDLARLECTCSEMRFLASNNDLWKMKLWEEFGLGETRGKYLKEFFALRFVAKKKSEQRFPFQGHRIGFPRNFPMRREPNPFGVPPIWGGEYDLHPSFGLTLPLYPPRRGFVPRCHLNEFNN